MAELTAQQRQQLEALLADALRPDPEADARAAAALEGIGDIIKFFCENWDTAKKVLTVIRSLAPDAVKKVIDEIIRLGDIVHGVICR